LKSSLLKEIRHFITVRVNIIFAIAYLATMEYLFLEYPECYADTGEETEDT
jgi:hypothetical protein